jgi:hypothetical protein
MAVDSCRGACSWTRLTLSANRRLQVLHESCKLLPRLGSHPGPKQSCDPQRIAVRGSGLWFRPRPRHPCARQWLGFGLSRCSCARARAQAGPAPAPVQDKTVHLSDNPTAKNRPTGARRACTELAFSPAETESTQPRFLRSTPPHSTPLSSTHTARPWLPRPRQSARGARAVRAPGGAAGGEEAGRNPGEEARPLPLNPQAASGAPPGRRRRRPTLPSITRTGGGGGGGGCGEAIRRRRRRGDPVLHGSERLQRRLRSRRRARRRRAVRARGGLGWGGEGPPQCGRGPHIRRSGGCAGMRAGGAAPCHWRWAGRVAI